MPITPKMDVGSAENALNDNDKLRLIELTKENTLLEDILNKLNRKYQNLEEAEKLLRRNYSEVEVEMADMEKGYMERIATLNEWKRNATFQLKDLYD